MNDGYTPTPLPEDLRQALDLILGCFWQTTWYDVISVLADEHFFDALNTVRFHLVGIPTAIPNEASTPTVRGEGWSL
ncbi:hypothetical protein RAS1_08860 [Phycisphaerae bacterium RAS1]|nr:hypothetical protein RAS1_08860 [Phycisphaerae bacterium RAS1]